MLTQREVGSIALSVSHLFSEHCLGPGTTEGSEDSRVNMSICHAELYALLGQSTQETNLARCFGLEGVPLTDMHVCPPAPPSQHPSTRELKPQ